MDNLKQVQILRDRIKELENALDLINKDIYATIGSTLDSNRYFKLRELCTNHLHNRPKE